MNERTKHDRAEPQVEYLPPTALMAMERAAVDTQIATAHRFPRDVTTFLQRACTMIGEDPALAVKCGYSTERGGKTLIGPSVRLAEIAANCWGNLRVNVRNEDVQAADTRVTVFVEVHDLESNVAVRVPRVRSITGRSGRFTEDMIGVTIQAAVSLAYRDGIFRVVPKHFIDDLYRTAMRVAAGEIKDMATTRADVVGTFVGLGVKAQRIFDALGIDGVEGITLEHVGPLREIAGRIKRKEITSDAAFPAEREDRLESKAAKGKDVAARMTAPPVEKSKEAEKPAPDPKPTTATKPVEKPAPAAKTEPEKPAAEGEWGSL